MNQFYEDIVLLSATPIRTRIKLTWRCYRHYHGDWNAMLKAQQLGIAGIVKQSLKNPEIIKSLVESIEQNNAVIDRLKKKGMWAAD